MGKKIEEIAVKIYKPEILKCPKCKSALKYKYTLSNKVVQFTSGKYFKIRNLGYGCEKCNDKITYFSQTANKMCFKGYTYSAKIVCTIAYYKELKYSRDTICNILADMGVEISDRNIDILYKKYKEIVLRNCDQDIKDAYQKMIDSFGEIRISIDLITIKEKIFVILYDFFTGDKLGLWTFDTINDPGLDACLASFISKDLNITYIATIRQLNNSRFVPLVKSLAPDKTNFFSFTKF